MWAGDVWTWGGRMTTKKYEFKKGQVVHLDDVYKLLGIIPGETIHTKDLADYGPYDSADYDENVKFLKNVSIKIQIKISD